MIIQLLQDHPQYYWSSGWYKFIWALLWRDIYRRYLWLNW